MLDSLQKQSSINQSRLSEELSSAWFQKSTQNHLKNTPQATVSPRVMGYEILKPKIRISRLNMSIMNRTGNQPNHAEPPGEPPEQDNNVDTTENIARASVPPVRRNDNIDADPEEVEEEEEPIVIRTRRRGPRPNPPRSPNMSALEENVEEEGREEMVLLFPRLVLDRIRLTPSRPSSAGSRRQSEEVRNSSPGPSTSTVQPETPRSRESFDDFTRRIGVLDPMEGPSWLFNDDNVQGGSSQATSQQPDRAAKSREERRKENSVKARLSSASRKLSLENNEDDDDSDSDSSEEPSTGEAKEEMNDPEVEVKDEEEPEEPRRRGGSRAAAKAARSSLKEPAMNTKLRQGDPVSKSVYDDFVPGTKRKSDRKSSKSSGKSKKKRSNEK